MKKTAWIRVTEYFNERLICARPYVSRKEFIYFRGFGRCNLTLIETYRCYLTRAGYLDHISSGIYKVTKPIPYDLTSKQCYRQAYPK